MASRLVSRHAAWCSSVLLLAALMPLAQALALQATRVGIARTAAFAACHGSLVLILLSAMWARDRSAIWPTLVLVPVLGLLPWVPWAGPHPWPGHSAARPLLPPELAMSLVLGLAALSHGFLASVLEAAGTETWRGMPPDGGLWGPFRSVEAREVPFRDRVLAVAGLLLVLAVTLGVACALASDGDWPWHHHTHCGPDEPGALAALRESVTPGALLGLGTLGLPHGLAILTSGRAWVLNAALAVLPGLLLALFLGQAITFHQVPRLVDLIMVGFSALPGLAFRFALPVLARRACERRLGRWKPTPADIPGPAYS